jgi:hypothetical protein
MVTKEELKPHLKVILLGFVCAILFTWPLILSPKTLIVSRQFDIYTFSWMVHIAQELDNFETTLSNWPIGQTLHRSDSLLMLFFAKLFSGYVDPWLFVSIMALLGITSTIWAAEQFARVTWNIPTPHSYLCGVFFGLSGISIVTLLEGPWYLFLNPWLPLVGTYTWLFTKKPSNLTVVPVIVFWLLCLLTSAYVGICASIIFLWITIWHIKNNRLDAHKNIRSWMIVYGSMFIVGVFYIVEFFSSGTDIRSRDEASAFNHQILDYGSVNLQNAISWSPEIDITFHSSAPIIGISSIAILAFSPLLFRGKLWLRWWSLAVFSVLLSFGYKIGFVGQEIQLPNYLLFTLDLPGILYPFLNTAVGSFVHFPLRFFWVGSLCCGLLLAKLSQQFSIENRIHFWIFSSILAIEVFIVHGTPVRKANTPIYTPEIYFETQEELAIFELTPNIMGHLGVESLFIKNVLCSYQIDHKRPVLQSCMGTTVNFGTDWILRNIFFDDILQDQTKDWPTILPNIGVGSIMFHPELFQASDRKIIQTYLIDKFGKPTLIHKYGEHLIMWNLQISENTNYEQYYLDFTKEFAESAHYINQ